MSELRISFSKLQQSPDDNAKLKFQSETNLEKEVSIFSPKNEITENEEPKVLTKEEIKAQKKQAKAEAKAEKKRIANTPDGIIQGGKQGSSAGDCWLLAQMNSMAKTDWGKDLFKEAITTDDNGNYTIHFKGINKDIQISQKDFKKAKGSSYYSSSDADALLLELAVERHFKEAKLNNETIKGNDLAGEDSLQYLLTGKKGRQTTNEQEMEVVLKSMAENPENNNGISATYIYHDNSPENPKDMNHAMSIQQVIFNEKGEIDKVVVLDSYHPDNPKTLSYKYFKNDLILFGYTQKPNN